MATIALTAFAVLLILCGFVTQALFIRLGLRCGKVEGVTHRRVALAMLALLVLQVASFAGEYWSTRLDSNLSVVLHLANLCATLFGILLIFIKIFHAKLWQALLTFVVQTVGEAIIVIVVVFGLRQYVFESFVQYSNSMAPTLLGRHVEGVCPECGGVTYCSPPENGYPDERRLMVCEKFHATPAVRLGDKVHPADRFVVAKYLTPQRWDLVVFHAPQDPTTVYVMRLVGLPGEEITIRDGEVYANGQPLERPEALRGLKYVTKIPYWFGEMWGSPEKPAKLGDDEYFMLGDNSSASKDSRLWDEGAPDHNPFAVPASYLVGVASQIYWPLDRCRSLR